LLGDEYQGYFEVDDTAGLAELMQQVESDPRFLWNLTSHCRKLAARFAPERELRDLKKLIRTLTGQA
jgi:glycosyltransferase involved in cell wall biosynthesis